MKNKCTHGLPGFPYNLYALLTNKLWQLKHSTIFHNLPTILKIIFQKTLSKFLTFLSFTSAIGAMFLLSFFPSCPPLFWNSLVRMSEWRSSWDRNLDWSGTVVILLNSALIWKRVKSTKESGSNGKHQGESHHHTYSRPGQSRREIKHRPIIYNQAY